jgi:hypothetical protein
LQETYIRTQASSHHYAEAAQETNQWQQHLVRFTEKDAKNKVHPEQSNNQTKHGNEIIEWGQALSRQRRERVSMVYQEQLRHCQQQNHEGDNEQTKFFPAIALKARRPMCHLYTPSVLYKHSLFFDLERNISNIESIAFPNEHRLTCKLTIHIRTIATVGISNVPLAVMVCEVSMLCRDTTILDLDSIGGTSANGRLCAKGIALPHRNETLTPCINHNQATKNRRTFGRCGLAQVACNGKHYLHEEEVKQND